MRCDQTELRLQTLLDNRQQVEEDAVLAEHVAKCGECATLVAAYELMAQPLPQAPVAGRVSADQVLDALNSPTGESLAVVSRESAGRNLWKRWAGLAVAASLVIALVVSRQFQQSEPAAGTPMIDTADKSAANPGEETAPVTVAVKDPPQVLGTDVWYRTGQSLASISLVNLSRYYASIEADNSNDESDSPWNFTPNFREFWPIETEPSPDSEGTGQFVRSLSYAMV